MTRLRRPSRQRVFRRSLAFSASLCVLALCLPAWADDGVQPRGTYGSVGMIEMPSARMASDGQLAGAATFYNDTERYVLDFQALPWLDVTLRYSGLAHFEPARPDFFVVYWDRSFAGKVRLFQETDYSPAIAIGANDLVGTGTYGAEYIVASKRLGAFDATAGIGWGGLAQTAELKNPLVSFKSSFSIRPGLTNLTPGQSTGTTFFHGPNAGLFGGLVWHTPINGLSLIAEYSSDKKQVEQTFQTAQADFKPRNQMNFGISYQPADNVTLGLDWLYGKHVAGTIAFQTDPTVAQYPAKIAADVPPVHSRTPAEQQAALEVLAHARNTQAAGAVNFSMKNAFVDHLVDRDDSFQDIQIQGRALVLTAQDGQTQRRCRELANLVQAYGTDFDSIVLKGGGSNQGVHCEIPAMLQSAALVTSGAPAANMDGDAAAIRKIRADANAQNIDIQAIKLTGSEAIVYYNNLHYYTETEALGRLTRVLMADAPARIEKFRMFAFLEQEFDVLRAPMERAFAQNTSGEQLLGNAITFERPPLQNPILDQGVRSIYPLYYWGLYPTFKQSLFDPNNPFAVELTADLAGSVALRRALLLSGVVETALFQNFPNRISDSLLPHVRSDLPLYVHKGATGIQSLRLDYRFRLAPDVYAVARAGYLESMFAAVGGEALWWPDGQRWAIGADMYEAQQRNYNRLFGLQKYRTFTGHVSLYYQSPWYNLDFNFRAGQYLAGDHGFTVEVRRRFATGVEIGAFFTRTNVPAAIYGEGSYDKGIIIRIPLQWGLPIATQGEFGMDLRPLQRDGGQVIEGDATLHYDLQRSSEDEISRHIDTFMDPGASQ